MARDRETDRVVATAEQLLASIRSNREIALQAGTFNLTDVVTQAGENIDWNNVYDGKEVRFRGLENVTFLGIGDTPSRIIVQPRYAYVLSLLNSNNVRFENLEFAHTDEKGECTGGVVYVEDCRNVSVSRCVLHGSGHEAITAKGVTNLAVSGSELRECTYSIMSIENCAKVRFTGCNFTNNREFDLITISASSDVQFDHCVFTGNETRESIGTLTYCFFFVRSSAFIRLVGCKFMHNRAEYFLKDEGSISLDSTEFVENTFRRGLHENPRAATEKVRPFTSCAETVPGGCSGENFDENRSG